MEISAYDGHMNVGMKLIGVAKPSSVKISVGSSSECVDSYDENEKTLQVWCSSIVEGIILEASGLQTSVV